MTASGDATAVSKNASGYYLVRNLTGQYIPENSICYCQKSGEEWLTIHYAPPIMIGTLDEVLESGSEAEMTITNTTGFQYGLGSIFSGGTMTVKDVMEMGDYQEGALVIAHLTTLSGSGYRYVPIAAWPCPGV